MYRSQPTVCAVCSMRVVPSEADVVPFGTGLRCLRCTLAEQVVAHRAPRPGLLARLLRALFGRALARR